MSAEARLNAEYVRCPRRLDSGRMFREANTMLTQPVRCTLRVGHKGLHWSNQWSWEPFQWGDEWCDQSDGSIAP